MQRREFLGAAGAAVSAYALSGASAAEETARRPNILMITCHDIGRHIGCYGVPTVATPNIDRLASRGVRFSNFYSTSAVCSPGRGSLHTGRYPQSNGLMGLTHAPWWWSLHRDERTLAQHLRDAGYHTSLIGLTHIGGDFRRLGYDEHLSRKRLAPETVEATKRLIANAKTADKPFFAKVGFHEVHRPFTHGEDREKGVWVPPWLQDTPTITADLAAYQATIRYFDARVGEILDALEASDVAKHTLVVFTSDHGIPYPGAKWTLRKAGIEVPFIMYQQGMGPAGRVVDDVMSNVDVLPTLLDWVGASIPDNVQGKSFRARLGGSGSAPRGAAFAQFTPAMKRDNESRCIITDRYHLIRYFQAGRAVDYPVDVDPVRFAGHVERCKTAGTRPYAQLYDLENDPYELKDIGGEKEHVEMVADLSRQLLEWMREVDDPLLHGPLATPYYRRALADLAGE